MSFEFVECPQTVRLMALHNADFAETALPFNLNGQLV